ncbi:predicted protein [Thalassiosira pseudonana CCMP1335]|uniref:Uncharacterized protein n=1 Tax=Thalassiosira pseudonana TaxID=35128 RepID=B8BVS5_THAPS|nr:predicted protein [Thalassiosira pseudonana CCMP1335]EED94986.1 predicted protein [Thalassiosira pseudonana CCMP1335]|eukprot:g9730.t1 g9730   contig4:454676-455947(-)
MMDSSSVGDPSKNTSSKKQAKKRLKSELKFRRKVDKLQTRIAHAISRKDAVVEWQAREELEKLKQSDEAAMYGKALAVDEDACVDPRQEAAINEVGRIFRRLLSSFDEADADESTKEESTKVQQTQKARKLLHHMTKGTQTSSMFGDRTALRGYVRQKFHGRASLIIKSFGKLSPEALQSADGFALQNMQLEHQKQYEIQKKTMLMCWEKLFRIERVCSIGSGPGNDAVGLIAFLRSYFAETMNDGGQLESDVPINKTNLQLKEVLMLDFAMNEWKAAALDDLMPILAPQYVEQASCETCDVTLPSIQNNEIKASVRKTEVFLTSYLLTETRNKWDQFYVQLVDLAPEGSLFFFAEPTPWQLHRLIRMSSTDVHAVDTSNPDIDYSTLQQLKYVWLDSSMHDPELQPLEGRVGGPAVLLAIKV